MRIDPERTPVTFAEVLRARRRHLDTLPVRDRVHLQDLDHLLGWPPKDPTGGKEHSAAIETSGILSSPSLMQDIADGRDAANQGDVLDNAELDQLLARVDTTITNDHQQLVERRIENIARFLRLNFVPGQNTGCWEDADQDERDAWEVEAAHIYGLAMGKERP